MIFDQWHEWAMGQHNSSPSKDEDVWKRVASSAQKKHDTCYDDASCGDKFRSRITDVFADKGPDDFSPEVFKDICRKKEDGDAVFQLQGCPIQAELPAFLSRVITVSELINYVVYTLRSNGATLFEPQQSNLETSLNKTLTGGRWTCVSNTSTTLSSLRVSVAHPASVRVFATFVEGDDKFPVNGHSPKFKKHLDEAVGRLNEAPPTVPQKRTAADVAAHWLALNPDRDRRPPDTYLLLYYPRDSVGSCRYPTPPDAEFFPCFCPVDPREEPHGWTHPPNVSAMDAASPEGQDPAVPEVVHPNPPIPSDNIWIVSLETLSPDTR